MPGTLLALQVLLILLPGFAASSVVDSLASRGKRSDFERVIEALLFSCVIYTAYLLLANGLLPFQIVGAGTANPTVLWDIRSVGKLAACTSVVALGTAVYINLDGNRLLRRAHLTYRTTRHSIWNDIFERVADKDQIVQVELADGRSVIGVLDYYSDDAEDASLFLRQASWVDEEANQIPIPGAGVLLTKSADIKSISLLDAPSPKHLQH